MPVLKNLNIFNYCSKDFYPTDKKRQLDKLKNKKYINSTKKFALVSVYTFEFERSLKKVVSPFVFLSFASKYAI